MTRTFGPYPATVVSIHDGDTMTLDIDLGFGIHSHELRCRIFGINAPELRTAAGAAALAYLNGILPVGAHVDVTSHGWDKYGGRFDGEVAYGGISIGPAMLAAGQAVVMTG